MNSRPDKAKEQLRQENRWWQKRYRRLQKRTDRLKREVQELKEQQRRLQLEIAEYRAKLYKAKARPAPEEAPTPRRPKKRGATKRSPWLVAACPAARRPTRRGYRGAMPRMWQPTPQSV